VESSLKQHEWGRVILHQAGKSSSLASDIGASVAQATGSVSTLLGTLTAVLVVLFIALYVAVEPETYINGFMRLVPANNRDRARDLIRPSARRCAGGLSAELRPWWWSARSPRWDCGS
jgi:predicted PurR-regulated permease PerM